MATPSKAARRAAARVRKTRATAIQTAHERGWKVIEGVDGRITIRR